MNTEDINKMLKEYGERTKQKINLIKPIDSPEGLSGEIKKEVKYKFGDSNNFSKKIDELNQETETLIDQIEKWQM